VAEKSGKIVNGVVAGPNPFLELHDFDFVKALVSDYLHSGFQVVFGYIKFFYFNKRETTFGFNSLLGYLCMVK
jgi:hypothetical protein